MDRAIEIAQRTGRKLRIAAKVDVVDEEYFHAHIEPPLNDPLVEYIGEIGEHEKGKFLGGAAVLLFPVDWREPFGLAMIEAMACGCPVIASRAGSTPEVVDEGVTGFTANGVEESARAVERPFLLTRGESVKLSKSALA